MIRVLLDELCIDLTARARSGGLATLVGRDQELRQAATTLASNSQRCLLITGEPGVGKSALVEGLACQIAKSGAEYGLSGKRILQLDLNALVGGTMYRGQLEERLQKVIREASSDRSVILFIDEFHTIDKAGGTECSLAETLKPYLARGEISVIGATTTQDCKQLQERNPALVRRFVTLEVKELSEQATGELLRQLAHQLSAETGLVCGESAIDEIIDLCRRYMRNRRFPDKAVAALRQVFTEKGPVEATGSPSLGLDNALILARQEAQALRNRDLAEAARLLGQWFGDSTAVADRCITTDDVKRVLSSECKVDTTDMEGEAFDRRALNLASSLKQLVIGQDRAAEAIGDRFKQMAVGLRRPNAPIGSFLFVGPTGVGKTELARSLAQILWGSRERMIRFDMSEYMEEHTVAKLIGAPPGYVGHDEPGRLTEAISENPFSVVLLDEIEKAHPRVANILLQVMEDGRLTDSKGKTVSFADSVIVMTSNVGSMDIAKLGRQRIEEDYENVAQQVKSMLCSAFVPELINRVDRIVVFSPLTQEELLPIFDLIAGDYNKRIRDERGIEVSFSDRAKQMIVALSYDPHMGARPLRRGLEDTVYAKLSERILNSEFKTGDKVLVDVGLEGITFRNGETA